ncbi:MAG: DUF3365 domain-containing protein [Pirellulales bacterium]
MPRTYRSLGIVALLASLTAWAAIVQSDEQPTDKPTTAEAAADSTAANRGARAKAKADDPALARARQTVQMLDDIYKSAVVLITDKYVHDEEDFPAGSAAVALFEAISNKGWHQVRLIDATGQPYEEKNVARDDFEKTGIERLKAGDALYERVVETDAGRQYRSLTPIPVVMQKCVMCHAHYADAKENEPIGAISYTLDVE